MRTFCRLLCLALVVGATTEISSQVVVESAPTEPSLLSYTREWSRESALGDLRALSIAADDIEVRAWGGYGLGLTEAIVLRRVGGRLVGAASTAGPLCPPRADPRGRHGLHNHLGKA